MPHISLVTLGVRDLAAATAFYEGLGWQRSGSSVEGEIAFLRGGTVALGLYPWDDLAADATLAPDAEGGFRGLSLAVNLPDPAAVDALVATAERLGAEVVKPPQQVPWGGYSGYVRDPDGHLWEIAHNPGWPLDDDGRVTLQD